MSDSQEVTMDGTPTVEARTEGFIENTKQRVTEAFQKPVVDVTPIKTVWGRIRDASGFATITNTRVEQNPNGSDTVVLCVSDPRMGDNEIKMSRDDVHYANLMELHNASSLADLEGEKIGKSFNPEMYGYKFPRSVSALGRFQYGLYGFLNTVSEKIRIPVSYDTRQSDIRGSLFSKTCLLGVIGLVLFIASGPTVGNISTGVEVLLWVLVGLTAILIALTLQFVAQGILFAIRIPMDDLPREMPEE